MFQVVYYVFRCLIGLLFVSFWQPQALLAQNHPVNKKMNTAGKESLKLNLRWGNAVFHPEMPKCALQLSIESAEIPETIPTSTINLYFLIDVSATMFRATTIQTIKTAMLALKNHLKPTDSLAVVVFSSDATVLTNLKPFQSGEWLSQLLDTLESGSSTNIPTGLSTVYSLLEKTHQPNTLNKIFLFTDGVTNARQTSPEDILEKIILFKNRGVQLSIFGFGQDLDTEQLTLWATSGNGLFYQTDDTRLTEQLSTEIDNLTSPIVTQFELSLEVPENLEIQQFLGQHTQIEPGQMTVRIPVIQRNNRFAWIATFNAPTASQNITTKAAVSYFDVLKKRNIRFEQSITLRKTTDTTQQFLLDKQVMHTYVLLTGEYFINKIEKLIQNKNLSYAQNICNEAINNFQTYFPDTTEPDLQQLYQTLQKYQEIIKKNISK